MFVLAGVGSFNNTSSNNDFQFSKETTYLLPSDISLNGLGDKVVDVIC